ncbi:hypothetical protein RhiirA1_485004 [Rhizophagus irregularis]|uniref:Uncharacterized protein n=1 Tax=Rhizophagus irregularis TaxID=588596 RepID=A0A2N0QIP6_9GLOM|nr:hypothetical protein RhiirA1_485004 [Rhizophagus irregularis]
MDDDPDSPYTIESILQKVFTEEKLKNKDNIKFGVTVAWMFLDPTYDQIEISSLKTLKIEPLWLRLPVIKRSLPTESNDHSTVHTWGTTGMTSSL